MNREQEARELYEAHCKASSVALGQEPVVLVPWESLSDQRFWLVMADVVEARQKPVLQPQQFDKWLDNLGAVMGKLSGDGWQILPGSSPNLTAAEYAAHYFGVEQ